ncbi:MAG: bifunctional riboflavin kinase/FAD synthetase [Anaerolineae bacterium]|nr:bifunctional riboflavin kinase/FAD synthetase [Anaerolineae bacterium]MDW8171462.1 bifunctional riboflavin kinase/FAD synthetase [Anaerolineae bacterium]
MSHLYRLEDAQVARPSLVTIGVFDGVHRGHQQLITRLVATARQQRALAVVLTFFPHPDVVLSGKPQERYYLSHPDERAALLTGLGVDLVITQTFDDQLRQIRAADYVVNLHEHLNLRELWVGADFALGYQREGNVTFLRQQGERYGFRVQTVDLVAQGADGSIISSSAVRASLRAGQVRQAAQWLGRSYALAGQVVHGDARGRTIGFPTANVAVWEEQVLPAYGVYAGWATLGSERFMAVTNVGVRPTFGGQQIRVEPHLLDFDRDIYGQTLRVTFEERLRGEQRFNGLDALKAQLARDVQAARAYLQANS